MKRPFSYIISNNTITVKKSDINLENTLFSGQAFRWDAHGEKFFGVVGENAAVLSKASDNLIIENIDEKTFIDSFSYYLDLYEDYDAILESFGFDELLGESIAFAPGIRVLNQAPFETLMTFIISANNNFSRIKLIVENISRRFGNSKQYLNRMYHTFPAPEILANASEADLRACGTGYRAPYIKQASKMVADRFDLESLKQKTYLDARHALTKLPGVGIKVADCVLLYGLGFANAFPMDVWTKRVIHNLYGLKSTKDEEIRAFITDKFGEYAGIAQQYLFYYAKTKKLGK